MKFNRHLKRLFVFSAVGVLLLGVAVGLIVWWLGASSIQQWIGLQIQTVANGYLKPHLSFTDLAYHYPLDVSLKNLHLTADDPAHPGRTIDIIACDSAELALGEIPRVGKPIVIEKIALKSPLISAVAIAPRSKQFIGFSNLLKAGPAKPDEPAKIETGSQKLSDVFRMRKVELVNGRIVYDPRIAGTVPMSIDQINTSLDITPTDASWYRLSTAISRKPVFDLSVAGQFNLDTFSTRELDLKLMTDLGVDKLQYLPPELQELLKRYQAKGKLNVAVSGAMPIDDYKKGDVHATLRLEKANIARGEFRLPVDGVNLDARVAGGIATLNSLKIDALGGTADLHGAVKLNDRLDADLHLKVADMMPEKLRARAATISAAPATLNFDFNLAASLQSLLGKAPPPASGPLAAISLQNFRLSSDDPAHPGRKMDVVACKTLDVSMSQPVLAGKPVVVDRIIFDRPVMSAVAVAPGSIEFAGMPRPLAESSAPDTPPSPANTAPLPSNAPVVAPGDMLRVKEFQLKGARITYDPRIAGTTPMVIDPINTSLHLDPKNPGVYRVDVAISRAPAFNIAVNGNVNINHPGLEKLKFNLLADLQQHQMDFLPPQLQLVLQHANARGKLVMNADASVVLADPAHGTASFDMNVDHLDIARGNVHVPVDSFSVSSKLSGGRITQTAKLAAMNNVFELDGVSTLNSRLDTDVVLHLKDVGLEKLLATLHPHERPTKTSTVLNADIELQSPALLAISTFAAPSDQPIGTLRVSHLRCTTDSPTALNQRLDFVSCDLLEAALAALPAPGQPVRVDHVTLTHPSVRAVAMSPGSDRFAGFDQLQAMARELSPAPSTQPAPAATTPTLPAKNPSDLFRLASLRVDGLSLYYNPWIYGTVPMKLSGITANVVADSSHGDTYKFDSRVAGEPDLTVDVSGRVNVNTRLIDPLKLVATAQLHAKNSHALPPQLQKQLQPFSPEGAFYLVVNGTLPGAKPKASDLAVNILADDVKATVNGYRLPIDHVRLPIHVKNNRLVLLDPQPLGGPTVSAFAGGATLTGTVLLDQYLTSTLNLQTEGMLLQDVMVSKIQKPAPDLVGAVHATAELRDAPLLIIAAHGAPPPGQGELPNPPSPLKALGLPGIWGVAHVSMDHARLAGFEIIQGINNIAKSVFANVINRRDKNEQRAVNPEETAELAMAFERDNVRFSSIHYEGEVVGADGKGTVTLQQQVNLNLTGGPQAKLAGLGGVGSWLKNASDSLLYYHVFGPVHDIQYEVKGGNGAPMVAGAKNVAQKTGKAVGVGIDKTKQFLGNIFKH